MHIPLLHLVLIFALLGCPYSCMAGFCGESVGETQSCCCDACREHAVQSPDVVKSAEDSKTPKSPVGPACQCICRGALAEQPVDLGDELRSQSLLLDLPEVTSMISVQVAEVVCAVLDEGSPRAGRALCPLFCKFVI